jgi:hypothetical protein
MGDQDLAALAIWVVADTDEITDSKVVERSAELSVPAVVDGVIGENRDVAMI